jgi:hypothetical protein
MMFTDGDTTTFHFLAPQKGTYLGSILQNSFSAEKFQFSHF